MSLNIINPESLHVNNGNSVLLFLLSLLLWLDDDLVDGNSRGLKFNIGFSPKSKTIIDGLLFHTCTNKYSLKWRIGDSYCFKNVVLILFFF